jgi:hypothetical protein
LGQGFGGCVAKPGQWCVFPIWWGLGVTNPCALSTNDLRNHIQSHIHPDTMTSSTTAKLHLITDYKKYKHALNVLDNAWICADELLKAAVKQMMSTLLNANTTFNKCSNNSRSATGTSATILTTSMNTTPSRSSDHCTPLTTIECTLLSEPGGCFRCRRFYTNHIMPNCTNRFPDKSTYCPLTEADVIAAKKCSSKSNKPTLMATIVSSETVPPTAVVMPSAVLGNSSESEYINTPFFIPQFFPDLFIGGSSAVTELLVCALINNDSDLILIDPVYADRLGLAHRKLPSLKEIVMAVGNGEKEVFLFDEYVPLTVVSSNQAWTSCVCHAILTPNLCVPILLGNPFLATKSIVIDHESHTCIDKKNWLQSPQPTCYNMNCDQTIPSLQT